MSARCTAYGLYGALQRGLAGCRSVLDLGCGTNSIVRRFAAGRFVVGVDRYYPSLVRNRAVGAYAALINADVLDLPFGERSFDAVVSLDVIEHFEKPRGYAMLSLMERLARRAVIVFTPNGLVPQQPSDNPWQEHKSGWTVEDFESRGYAVHGIYGHKSLRGEYSRLNRRPQVVWEGISMLSHLYTGTHPRSAFGLCAVRRLG